MRLINGRGQLGQALALLSVPEDVLVYHTWNLTDKGEAAQRSCYDAFVKFRATNAGRLVLISTSSSNDNAYVKYKRLAEPIADGVIRLPTLIGTGICQRFRDDYHTGAWGTMELLSVELAAAAVAAHLHSGKSGVVIVPGTKVPAYVVKELIRFGAGR